MKIRNEQLRALQEAEARRAPKTGKEFTELFSRELNATAAENTTEAHGVSPQPGLQGTSLTMLPNPALKELQDSLASSTDRQPLDAATLTEAAEQMEDLLASLEDYASQLANEEKADLRQAYSLLEGVSNRIDNFKTRFSGLDEQHAGFAALFNELDVLATTETFKFNRGDYL